MCIRACLSLWTCFQASVRRVCWDTWCTCVKQMTPMPVWVSPRCAWCMDHVVQSARGPHWLNRPGIVSECGPEFALSEGTVHLLSTAFNASELQGRSVLDQPPAGRIRCYLSDWGHRHQSLLSTFLCPESNQQRVIHLRWRHVDKISNRVCQNIAMFAWCVEREAIISHSKLSNIYLWETMHSTNDVLKVTDKALNN